VSHLSLSPLTMRLFQRAIGLGGAASAYYGYTEEIARSTKQLGLMLLCPYIKSTKIVECLRNRRKKILESAAVAAPLTLGRRVPNWVPRVDGYLVSDEPRRALQKGLSKDVDLLIGSTIHDGAFLVYLNPGGMRFGDLFNLCKYQRVFMAIFRLLLTPYVNRDVLAEMIEQEYPDMFNFDSDLTTRSKAAVQFVTDFLFVSAITLEAEQHSKFGKETGRSTYLFEFAYRQSFHKYKPWIQGSHLDDLYSVFGEPFMKQFRETILRDDWSKTDLQVKTMIQHYYANFAYTGNPNEGPYPAQAFWPQFDSTDRSYIKFQRKGVSADAEHKKQNAETLRRVSFWNDLFYRTANPATFHSTASEEEVQENTQEFLFAIEEALVQIENDLENEDYNQVIEVLSGLLQHLQIDVQR